MIGQRAAHDRSWHWCEPVEGPVTGRREGGGEHKVKTLFVSNPDAQSVDSVRPAGNSALTTEHCNGDGPVCQKFLPASVTLGL